MKSNVFKCLPGRYMMQLTMHYRQLLTFLKDSCKQLEFTYLDLELLPEQGFSMEFNTVPEVEPDRHTLTLLQLVPCKRDILLRHQTEEVMMMTSVRCDSAEFMCLIDDQ